MTTFIESPRFPDDISYGSRGGPRYKTTKVAVASGAIYRNLLWSYPRHEYDMAYGVNTVAKHEQLLYFYHVVGGPAVGFRVKDWLDFKSCLLAAAPAATDVQIGAGTGALTAFQLIKTYVRGSFSRSRKIIKPISPVLVAVAGSAKTEGVHFNVDYATGIVTFTGGNIPAAGQAVTAGFQFDVPVCFAQDLHQYTWKDFASGMAQVPLLELKYGDA